VELDQDGRARDLTPGEITPARFSHPLLVAQKMAPVAIEAPKWMRRSA